MKLQRVIGILIALAVAPDMSLACTLSPLESDKSSVAAELKPIDICLAFASAIWPQNTSTANENICANGEFRPSEGVLTVTTGNFPEFPIFDIWIVARSDLLAKVVGDTGFESQRYRLSFMLNLKCENRLILQDLETRLIRADWSIAINERNPNWHLFSDGEAQFGLYVKLQEQLKIMLTNKVLDYQTRREQSQNSGE